MAESPIQQFLNYPYRNWIVAGATILLMLLISLPAYERLARVRAETSELTDQIRNTNESLANLPALQKQEARTRAVVAGRLPLIDSEGALHIREELVRMMHALDCRLLNIQLKDPQSSPWSEGDDPLATKATNSRKATEFQLVRTRLSFSAEGSLGRITRLIDQLSNLHDYAVPTSMHLRQQSEANLVKIEMELALLNLKRDTT